MVCPWQATHKMLPWATPSCLSKRRNWWNIWSTPTMMIHLGFFLASFRNWEEMNLWTYLQKCPTLRNGTMRKIRDRLYSPLTVIDTNELFLNLLQQLLPLKGQAPQQRTPRPAVRRASWLKHRKPLLSKLGGIRWMQQFFNNRKVEFSGQKSAHQWR